MFLVLGSTLSVILVVAAIRHEIRSAAHGITLSNGVEVLVSPEMYGEILRRDRVIERRG